MIYIVTQGDYEDYKIIHVLEGIADLDIKAIFKEFEAMVLTRILHQIGREPIPPKLESDKKVLDEEQLKLWNEINKIHYDKRTKWYNDRCKIINDVCIELQDAGEINRDYYSIHHGFVLLLKKTYGMKEVKHMIIDEGCVNL
jgi:hypothetical protein